MLWFGRTALNSLSYGSISRFSISSITFCFFGSSGKSNLSSYCFHITARSTNARHLFPALERIQLETSISNISISLLSSSLVAFRVSPPVILHVLPYSFIRFAVSSYRYLLPTNRTGVRDPILPLCSGASGGQRK